MDGNCAEKFRLLRVWSFANSDYSRAVMALHSFSGVMPRAEYERVRKYSESTRELADQARQALELHRQEHGC